MAKARFEDGGALQAVGIRAFAFLCRAYLLRAQVSLEMDGESEDEVEALGELMSPSDMGDGAGAGPAQPPLRFVLLRELWASAR